MPCICGSLTEIEKVESNGAFFTSLPVIEAGDWVKLCQCPSCNQLWCVDEWDKLNISFARKLRDSTNWQSGAEELQKQYLARARGVQKNVSCVQAGCDNVALNGSAFCVEHLYEMGWRE